jgi:hypothetical protein
MLKSKIILGFSGEGFPRFVSYEENAQDISTSTNPVLRGRAKGGPGCFMWAATRSARSGSRTGG